MFRLEMQCREAAFESERFEAFSFLKSVLQKAAKRESKSEREKARKDRLGSRENDRSPIVKMCAGKGAKIGLTFNGSKC